MITTNIIIGVGFVLVFIDLFLILASLSKIYYTLNIIAQVISVAIQRSGLVVRTPEEVKEDALAAEEDLEE